MMLFFRKYGFLFIPPVYWLIYLGVRLTYNGLAGEFSPDFFQGIRHEGVYIICSLCVFYWSCIQCVDAPSNVVLTFNESANDPVMHFC